MATLRNLATQSERRLCRRITVGRESTCELCLTSVGVSKQHAAIEWTGAQWLIRDLGSRNGTKVNQKLLLSTSFPLAPGDEIVFGDPHERWSWVDGDAPVAAAVRDDGVEVSELGGMLVLPDESAPLAIVLVMGEQWQLEMGGRVSAIRDGAMIDVQGRRFTLHLPTPNPAAERTQTMLPRSSILDASISFFVSLDEEHVRIVVESEARTLELPSRAFHYMLLLLGRQRAEDTANGIPGAECGWVYTDELASNLRWDDTQLNTNVCRARQAAATFQADGPSRSGVHRARAHGDSSQPWFKDPQELLQRRSGQIRLGPSKIFIRDDRSAAGTPAGE